METTNPAPLLQIHDVGRRYGDRWVLRSVTLRLRAGGCLALVGDNGSGKSTLLRIAAGRDRPTSGSVLLDGRPVDEDDVRTRSRVATVMDSGTCYPDLTVREHLELVAAAHGLGDRTDHEVGTVLAAHHLGDHADALPAALSSGQTQALLLASAMVRPHDLLILDEPEQRLDHGARERLAQRLADHRAQGTAVLLATHHRALAEAVADQVLTLADGTVLAHHESP